MKILKMINRECPLEREITAISLNTNNRWMKTVKVHQREEIEWKMNNKKAKDLKNIHV